MSNIELRLNEKIAIPEASGKTIKFLSVNLPQTEALKFQIKIWIKTEVIQYDSKTYPENCYLLVPVNNEKRLETSLIEFDKVRNINTGKQINPMDVPIDSQLSIELIAANLFIDKPERIKTCGLTYTYE